MSLTDIMSHAGLAAYAEIAMILFLLAFIAIVIQVMGRRRASDWEAARRMPLDDTTPQTPRIPSPTSHS